VDHVTFDGLTLLSAPGRVMTPRSATESLVAAACAWLGGGGARVADVGTGSGAIAVAVASACPEIEVWATDSNPLAVALARRNIRRHGLDHRVVVRRSDLLEGVPAPLDLVVANLPYLPSSAAGQYPGLAGEPDDAVFAAGDGLDPYRRLIDAAGTWLADDGALLLQLHRRVVAATRAELRDLREALDGTPTALAA
jgi:release factor glutamine methyltransferase